MLTSGDRIKMVNSINGLDCLVNKTFDVINVENGVISFKSSFGIGFMSEDEFKNNFVMVRNWTNWIHTVKFYAYKTDNKKYVKVKKDGYCVRASCHPTDEFDLNVGIAVCLKRIKEKMKCD